MDTITAIHTRRSIRDYEKRTVEREIIADILWDAAQAPTTRVSGPFLFHVIEGAARIALLADADQREIVSHRVGKDRVLFFDIAISGIGKRAVRFGTLFVLRKYLHQLGRLGVSRRRKEQK